MTDLGDLARIATALGLVRDGSPNDDWFAEPDRFLAQVLSDPQQRDALVGTLDDLLGGGDAAAGGARTRVPILERGAVALALVIDVVDGGSRVHLGLGVRVRRTADADSAGVRIEAYVPLFAADGSEQVASPLLLGAVDGTIELELAVELPTSTAVGGVALTAVEVGARIPTIGGATPVLTLALRGLRMPGSPDPTDLVVDPAALGGLGGTLTELVLALLRARTSDLPVNDPARALAGLLGLIPGDDVPDFPFVALAARGPVALAGWWASALEGAARASWLGYLADLLGAQVVTPAGLPVVVALDLGGDANLTIGLDVLPGAAGLPSVTPNLTVETRGATGVTLALEAQPVSVDLATHAAVALPALRLVARVADPAGGSLLGPVDSGTPAMSVRLGSLEAGFALDADRRPTLVLAALDAQVGATPYDRLDLTNGDAVAAASAQTVAQVAGSLISGLGTLGGVLGPLIGLSGPVPVDPVRLLSDPVGAIRDRWAALLDEPAATVRGVLQTLQGAISDAARAAEPVSGAGTAADPYRIALAEGVDLVITRDGTRVAVDLAVHRAADLPDGALGGARMALDARAGVLRADLAPATAAASFATGLLAIVAAEPSGVAPLELEAGGLTLRASSVGVRVAWTPDAGARVDPWLTSPRLDIDGPELVQSLDLAPLMEAGLAVGGPDALALPPAIPPPPADWATAAWPTLEAVTGAAMRAVDAPWAVAFAELAGWAEEPAAGVPRLSLEALVDDPAAETQRWTRHAVGLPATGSGVDDPATLARSLRALAEFAGVEVPSGTGLPGLPWSVPFPGLSVVGSLAGSEASRLASLVPADLGSWASGDPPLPLGALVEAVIAEASVDSVLADALAGRSGALAAGLEGLIERWAGTDGVVAVAADHVPAGLTVHRPVDLTHTAGLDSPAVAAAVAAAIGTAPVRLVLVGVVAPGEPDLLPATGDTVVDLTAAGVAANTFSLPPTAAAGVTVVRLPGKADAVGPDGGAGFDAQVSRLRRALEGLAPIGSDVTVVAGGAAGRVAVAASEGLGITHVVTVATPWTELSLADVDAPTTGEAVRWLRTLLALADDEEAPADPDLALVRGLVDGLLCRDGRGDPLTELTAPARAVPPGLDAHAIVGSVDAERVRTAITALVARVVDVRIARRAADAAAAAVSNAIGVRLPSSFGVAAGGLRAALDVDVDVVRSTAAGAGGVGGAGGGSGAPADERVLTCTLRLGGDGRWLVGGPDPSRAPGLRPLALRALTIEATVPFSFAEPAAARVGSGRLVLHDAVVFGVHRARWPVDLSETGALLPEVRGLLGEVAAAIRAEAVGTVTRAVDPGIAALRSLLESVGLLGADGGFDAVTLAHLMGDPGTVLRAALAEPSRRERIAAAVRQAVGDTRAGAGATIEVAGDANSDGRTVRVDLSGPSLLASTSVGAIRLTASLERASATITADVSPHHAVAVVASCRADRSGTALDVGARIHDRTITLLPAAPDAASAIAGLLPVELRAAVLRIVLGALRSQLPTELPTTPAGLVDAILEAAGLLREADATGRRALRWADGLLADPREWVRSRTAGLPASVPAMLDAVRGLVAPALPATAGAIPITSGVVLRAQPVARGLRVAIDVDAGAFAGAPAELVLRAGIGVIGEADGRVTPDVGLTLGAAPGALAVVVAPRADGIVGTTVALRPTARPEVVLHPGGHGLTSLADAAAGAAVAALPRLLNALIAEDPAGAPAGPVQSAARLVSRAGRALGLADAGPDGFTAERIADFVADPVAALSTRASALTADGIALVVDAVDTALGSSPDLSVRSTGSGIELLLGPTGRRVRLVWSPGANTYEVQVALAGPAAIGTVAASAHLHGTGGLTAFAATLGPGAIPLGGVMLAPFARFATGATGAVVDIGLSAGGASRVLARITASGVDFAAELGDFAAPSLATTPGDIARAVLAALLELAGGLVLQIDEVRDLLAVEVGTADTPVRELLDGVLLVVDPADPTAVAVDPALVADLADPARLLGRLGRLAANLASGLGTITLGETLEVGLVDDGTKLGLRLDVTGDEWVLNPGGDILVSLVSDGGWLAPPATADGIVVTILERTATGMVAAPGLVVAGVGVRISRASGALLDAGLSIETLTMLVYGEVGASGLGGGLRLELGGLGLPLAGATGGDNAIAKGVMPSGGTDDDAPAPKFSPALAVQRHPGAVEATVHVSAGAGGGPWWLRIQREFGPVYLEQVGLAVVQDDTGLESIAVLIDGRVSLFGFSASVDDLSLTYFVSGGSPFSAENWHVDVAGFAITAETSGLTLAGGLRKFAPAGGGVEYLGMLLARYGPYGITVYGGFGEAGPPGDRYSSLFLFGAVNGPIGGVPAFFVTGIGGGFGVNRRLVIPSDLNRFPSFPPIRALDPAARAGDPFTELEAARGYFPAERGTFWFAGGLSFTSFALVEGVVVVAIQFGNGFELSLLGLARMALPRPEAALVSIELALAARVSASDGVLLVQAQLTENSWLLVPRVRLTGGFAFATWFAGPNKGQFVLTIGGFHPDFHRDGYPVVPRLGLQVQFSPFVTIRGTAYFALTSEALMAGVQVDIHAELGPAWAHLTLGADAIVYYDPFWMEVEVYASVRAGITIDLWFTEVTFTVSISARVTVSGPPFHAIGELEIGPASVTVEIGDRGAPQPIDWARFVEKYLEQASPGVGRVLSAITGAGTVPPAGGATAGGARGPDGQPDRPFTVVAEFTATVVSTVPLRGVVSRETRSFASSRPIAVAPMGTSERRPGLVLGIRRRNPDGSPDGTNPDFVFEPGISVAQAGRGAFPVGVWGPSPDLTRAVVPSGDVLSAVDRVAITARAVIPGDVDAAPAIPYRQVETGARRILPLLPSVEAAQLDAVGQGVSAAEDAADAARASYPAGLAESDVAERLLVDRGGRTGQSAAAWRAGLAAPARLGFLGEAFGVLADPAVTVERTVAPPPDRSIRAPRLVGRFAVRDATPGVAAAGSVQPGRAGRAGAVRTSVSRALLDRFDLAGDPTEVGLGRGPAPTLDAVAGRIRPAVSARLVRSAPLAAAFARTVVPPDGPAATARGGFGASSVAHRTASAEVAKEMATATDELVSGRGAIIDDGTVLVLALPDAAYDTRDERPSIVCRSGRVRVVVTGGGAHVLADRVLAARDRLDVPADSRDVVVIGGPAELPIEDAVGPRPTGEVADRAWTPIGGWLADRPMPSASDGLLVGAGCVLDVRGRAPRRGRASAPTAWATPAELLGAEATATTMFAAPSAAAPIAAVAVVVTGDGADGLAIGLEGATATGERLVTRDADGASVLVLGLRPERDAERVAITVAAEGEPRHLGGILAVAAPQRRPVPAGGAAGVETTPAALARAIAERGLRALVPEPAVPSPATSTVRWRQP